MDNYLTLEGGPRPVEIGAFLSEKERLSLKDDLERALPPMTHGNILADPTHLASIEVPDTVRGERIEAWLAQALFHHRANLSEIHLPGVFRFQSAHDLAHVADRTGAGLGYRPVNSGRGFLI